MVLVRARGGKGVGAIIHGPVTVREIPEPGRRRERVPAEADRHGA